MKKILEAVIGKKKEKEFKAFGLGKGTFLCQYRFKNDYMDPVIVGSIMGASKTIEERLSDLIKTKQVYVVKIYTKDENHEIDKGESYQVRKVNGELELMKGRGKLSTFILS